MKGPRKKVVVMISGSGRSLANLIDHFKGPHSPIDIVGVISSRANVKGLKVAEAAGIPAEVIRRRDFINTDEFSSANTLSINTWDADFIVMAGYLSFYPIPPSFIGRTINIHPSLLPLFGGKGFYGHHVHEAVLESGVRLSGCTVHFVDNDYDKGPIILQLPCPVEATDTADSLAARVFELEKRALPMALGWLAAGSVRNNQGSAAFAADFQMPWATRFSNES